MARKFAIFEPMSKFTRLRTLLKYRSLRRMISFHKGERDWLLTVKEVRLSLLNVNGYLGSDLVQSLLQSLLDDHPVERTRKQGLLVLRRVRIVNAAFFGNQGVQFTEHEAD